MLVRFRRLSPTVVVLPVLAVAAVVLAVPAPARAQLPAEMIGMWSTGDCVDGETLVIFTGPTIAGFDEGLVLRFRSRAIETQTYRTKAAPEGRVQVRTPRDDFFVRLQDGELHGVTALAPELPEPDAPPQDDTGDGSEDASESGEAGGDAADAPRTLPPLRSCERAPARWQIPHGELLAFIAAQPQMAAQCDGSDLARCLSAVMSFGDATGDGALSEAEITRLLRTLVHFSSLAAVDRGGGAATVNEGDLLAAVGGTSAVGLAISKAVVLSFDFDGSGTVSRDEFAQDRRIPPGTPFDTDILRELRGGIDQGFDSFIDVLENLFDGFAEPVAAPVSPS